MIPEVLHSELDQKTYNSISPVEAVYIPQETEEAIKVLEKMSTIIQHQKVQVREKSMKTVLL